MKSATLTIIMSTTILAFAAPHLSYADETVNASAHNWKKSDITIQWGRGFTKEAQNTPSPGEFIYTDGPNVPGTTAIMCFEGKLQAVIAVGDKSINESVGKAWRGQRTRSVRPDFTINGKAISGSYWAYQPNTQLAIPRRPKLTRQIYNASIRGDAVELDLAAKDNVSVILPKPNADFAEFGAECGVGRNKKPKKPE